jgi:hypothetical protein
METILDGLVATYEIWGEERWYRTWVTTFNNGAWVVGMAGEWYVIWLDGKSDKPVLITSEEMAW